MAQYIGSSTVLTAGSTYTSRWVNSDIHTAICGSVFADQPGTLYIEQSYDGVNADISASYNTTANDGEGYSENLLLPLVRLKFTNTGGSSQTVFRLVSKFLTGEMP